MKTLFTFLVIYLMTSGGSCRQAEFISNSRLVIEGTAKDSLQKPMQNVEVNLSNGITRTGVLTKNDGSFRISAPATDVGSTLNFSEKSISEFQCEDTRVRERFSDIMIPTEVSYVKMQVTLK